MGCEEGEDVCASVCVWAQEMGEDKWKEERRRGKRKRGGGERMRGRRGGEYKVTL